MKSHRIKGLMFLIIASVLWSTGGVLIKYIDWNPMAIAGMRSGISAIVMILYLRHPFKLRKINVLGASFYSANMFLFVIATKMTTSANAILLQYTAPIWVALLSGWLLKEKILKIDWFTIALVMGGMILFFVGDIQIGQMTGNILSIISGISLACVIISLKLSNDGSPVEIPLLGNILTFVLCLPFIFTTIPSFQSIIAILLLGIFQLGISYILFTEGSRYLSAIEIILIAVIEPLLNPVWVFIFTKEAPSKYAIIGGVIVILGVISRNILISRKK